MKTLIIILLLLSNVATAQNARQRRESRQQQAHQPTMISSISSATASGPIYNINNDDADSSGVDDMVDRLTNPVVYCTCSTNDVASPVVIVDNYGRSEDLNSIGQVITRCRNEEGEYHISGSRAYVTGFCDVALSDSGVVPSSKPQAQQPTHYVAPQSPTISPEQQERIKEQEYKRKHQEAVAEAAANRRKQEEEDRKHSEAAEQARRDEEYKKQQAVINDKINGGGGRDNHLP